MKKTTKSNSKPRQRKLSELEHGLIEDVFANLTGNDKSLIFRFIETVYNFRNSWTPDSVDSFIMDLIDNIMYFKSMMFVSGDIFETLESVLEEKFELPKKM